MIEPKEGEPRIQYLARVLKAYMEVGVAAEHTIEYDGAVCDGYCLAEDIFIEAGCVEDDE